MESSSGDCVMRGPVLGRATCQTRLRQPLLPQHEVSDCTHFRIAYYTAAAVVSTKIVRSTYRESGAICPRNFDSSNIDYLRIIGELRRYVPAIGGRVP